MRVACLFGSVMAYLHWDRTFTGCQFVGSTFKGGNSLAYRTFMGVVLSRDGFMPVGWQACRVSWGWAFMGCPACEHK